MSHIKSMISENIRAEIQENNDNPQLLKTLQVYKPSHTIEFNREGEVLLYSCEPWKHVQNLRLNDFRLKFTSNTLFAFMKL